MIELPKKDKKGMPYLSYSQIKCFKENKQEYKRRYMLGKKFEGNEYIDFGSRVGKALENNDFSGFTEIETKVLKGATRLDEFERRVKLNFGDFYLIGYIDTNTIDLVEIIDYKTGGYNKAIKYTDADYTQLQLYALAIKQETGITPKRGIVEFITRGGAPWKDEELFVADEPIIKIEMNLSEDRLDAVYYQTIEDAKKISEFYIKNK